MSQLLRRSVRWTTVTVTLLALTCAPPAGAIVNGEDAEDGEFPGTVSLRYASTHFCGGALIGESTVITAAHCVKSVRRIEKITVVAGTNQLSKGGETRSVTKAVIHPDYSTGAHSNDVAILTLDKPMPISETIKTVPLQVTAVADGTAVTIAGWGSTTVVKGPPSEDLQKLDDTVMNREACNKKMQGIVTDGMLCTTSDTKTSTCSGDSGGPVMVEGRVAGLVSGSLDCGNPKYPSIHADVSEYYAWIKVNS